MGEVSSQSYSVTATWTDRTAYLDYTAFSRAIDTAKYSSYQTAYQNSWTAVETLLNGVSHEGGSMDYALKKRIKALMKRGTPDAIMTRLIVKLFRLDSFKNAERFTSLRTDFAGKQLQQ